MDDAVLGAKARARFPGLNVVLFLATLLTTLGMGFVMAHGDDEGALAALAHLPVRQALARFLEGGLPFAGSLVAILLTHEMGHYVLARRHRVDATLPFFIPVPFGFGTLGAVIRIRSALPSRRATLEIGAAGPIAGFCVALPLLVWGFAHSQLVPAIAAGPATPASPWMWLHGWLTGTHWAGELTGVSYGDSLLTAAVTRLTHGPLPPGTDLVVHPVALAAWIGMFITALNLLPVGQLDGGHVLYAALGRERARRLSGLVSWGLLACGLFLSWIWLVWWALTRFLTGLGHPPALREEPLGRAQQVVAVIALVLLVITFVPVPAVGV